MRIEDLTIARKDEPDEKTSDQNLVIRRNMIMITLEGEIDDIELLLKYLRNIYDLF
jgi:hypothetical protein